ncbi:retrovirus-related Pol polyprotein from transposon TNT 1-94 isoform X1 [Diospyros lotus]|uniref:retrovirus-related Pol polyprotein from transposon TNT 1-94 isoform X1 n=1 Tax=Diospyros lotus TaxID=55363 RepID=UPI0022544B84|nr:retrovirus-related Pol polyprotein from transposon TNT 1-94 isoform X1 [Diospyros lotus]XP_052174286.1 retrovirus-related Pol polyprotein from transposon TNT 1-94 isoform X1 [Diospyros lotus]
MQEVQKLQNHIDEFNKLCLDLENLSISYEEKDKALILLHSLPKSYEHFVDILKHGRDTISLKDVIGAINSKDLQQKVESKKTVGDALSTRYRSEKKDPKAKGKSRSKSKNGKKTFRCFHCHEEGHIKKNCPKRKQDFSDKGKSEFSNSTRELDYDSLDVLVVSRHLDEVVWVLDSGCSFHMSPHIEWFLNYKDMSGGKVLLGNNQECGIKGIGDIKLKMFNGSIRTLTSVRYVPELKKKLISVGELAKNGYSYSGCGDILKVAKGSLICMKAVLKNGIFFMIASTVCGDASIGEEKTYELSKLWHFRMAHISIKGLKELANQGILGYGKMTNLDTCETCIYGKSVKTKSPKKALHITKGPLEYAHSDLWDPSQTPTHGGARYFLSIINDYTRMVWVSVLKTKDNTFDAFKT